MSRSLIWSIGLPLILGCETGPGPEDLCPAGETGGLATVSFRRDIVPVLTTAGCLSSACHGGSFPSSGYDLTTYEASFVPGDEAKSLGVCEIVPGDPESSFLVEKLRSRNPRVGLPMPLEREPLTEARISLIETWIREGAQDN